MHADVTDGSLQDLMRVQVDSAARNDTEASIEGDVAPMVMRYIIGFVGIVAVLVFGWIAFKLFTADGKEEEFKNAWKALVYAAIGIALIPISVAVVRIVLGISF